MAEGSVAATRAARRRPSPWATRVRHAAFAWALLFAAGWSPSGTSSTRDGHPARVRSKPRARVGEEGARRHG